MCGFVEKPAVCLHPGGRTPVWDRTGYNHPRGSGLTGGVMERWANTNMNMSWARTWQPLPLVAMPTDQTQCTTSSATTLTSVFDCNPVLRHMGIKVAQSFKCTPPYLVLFYVSGIKSSSCPSSSLCSILHSIQSEWQWEKHNFPRDGPSTPFLHRRGFDLWIHLHVCGGSNRKLHLYAWQVWRTLVSTSFSRTSDTHNFSCYWHVTHFQRTEHTANWDWDFNITISL